MDEELDQGEEEQDELEEEDPSGIESAFNSDEDEGEPDEEGEEESAENEEGEEEEAPSVPTYDYSGDDPDMQLLHDTLGPEAAAALLRVQNRQSEAASIANMHITAAAAENPELFRVYGARISHAVNRLDPALRSKPEGVNVAIASLLIEEAGKRGMKAALARLASLSGGGTAPKAKTPIPATQRPPSPATTRATPGRLNKKEADIKFLMDSFGLDRKEAELTAMDARTIR